MRIPRRSPIVFVMYAVVTHLLLAGGSLVRGGEEPSILKVGISGRFDTGKEPSDGEYLTLSVEELYWYNEENLREALDLAPKITVRFAPAYSQPENQEEFLSKSLSDFPPHEYEQELIGNRPSNRWLVLFEENTPPATLIDALNLINRSDMARADLIFLINGIEAEMTGMTIEPKEYFSASDFQAQVLHKLKQYGDFTVGAMMTSGDGSFHLSFSEIKPPLTLLRLVNLIHTDAWVRRAYPKFSYLRPAITAELKVTPETGQLDEVRTVSLTVRNFTPGRIQVDPQLISPLGSAEFIPKSVGGGRAKYFEVSPEPEIRREELGRGEVVTLTWKLHLFEVQATGADLTGKWTLPGPPVNFLDNGELKTITANTANFFVISHLAGVVASFPPATPLTVPELLVAPRPPSPFTPSPSWLDSVPLPPTILLYTSLILAGIFGVVSLVHGRTLLRRRKLQSPRESPEKPWQERCSDLLNEAPRLPPTGSYQKVYEALFLALRNAFPGKLSPHPELEEVIENCGNRLDEKERHLLTRIFTELERVYRPNFTLQEEALAKVISDVRSLVTSLGRGYV